MELVDVSDTWTDEANPTQNRGNDTTVSVYPVTNKRHRSLLQFDLSQIPAGACVGSATLQLTLVSVGTSSRTYGVYRVTQSWTEGNGLNNSGATWATRNGVTPWTAPGGDAVTTATAVAATGITAGATLQWDVTADVAAFIADAVPNEGWLLKDANEGTGTQFRFASREGSPSPSVPHLELAFTTCP